METRYFLTLVMVAEKGSFSRAAEALNITQSAASQRVKFLEEQYGHQLLNRSGTSLVPTRIGEKVLAKARGILEKERELLEVLKGLDSAKRLSLCCTPTFGMAYLPGALNDFMLQNSDVADIKFVVHQPEEALRGLQEDTFDLAIIEHFDDYDLNAFRTLALPEDELVFISAPSFDLPHPTLHPEDLLPHRLYARRDGCSSKQLLIHNLAAAGKEIGDFKGVVISDDLRFTVEEVLAARGVSFLSWSLVAPYIDSGRLRMHHVEGFTHLRFRTALFRRNHHEEPLMRDFLDCVLAVFENQGTGVCLRNGERRKAIPATIGLEKNSNSG